jgi:hypothetical protein
MSATISVERQAGGYTDRARAYKVLVDGDEKATVKHGQTAEVEVAPGEHELQMKVDWATSPPLRVELADGDHARFACAPNANPLTAWFYAFFKRSVYIRLEPVAPGSSVE